MSTTTFETTQPKIRPWRYLAKIVRQFPYWYLGLLIGENMFFAVFPQFAGLLMRAIFDNLSGEATAGANVYTLIALLIANATAKAIASADSVTVSIAAEIIGILIRIFRVRFVDVWAAAGTKSLRPGISSTSSKVMPSVVILVLKSIRSLPLKGF